MLFKPIARFSFEFMVDDIRALKVYHEGKPLSVASNGLSTFPGPKSVLLLTPLNKVKTEKVNSSFMRVIKRFPVIGGICPTGIALYVIIPLV